jgi:uncharacterized protein
MQRSDRGRWVSTWITIFKLAPGVVRSIWICGAALLACGSAAQNPSAPARNPPATTQAQSVQIDPMRVEVHRDVMISMRDGIQLATDIYLPKEITKRSAERRYPVILTRTPYDKLYVESPLGWIKEAVIRGYVVVAQDVRGTHASQGMLRPLADDGWGERRDGTDTLAWIARQPWSNGRVGTTGMSYSGAMQLLLALSEPTGLVTSFVEAPAVNPFTDSFVYTDGAFALGTALPWSIGVAPDVATHLPPPEGATVLDELKSAPNLASSDNLRKILEQGSLRAVPGVRTLPFWQDWLDHWDDPAFFSNSDVHDRLQDISVPLFLFGGWYDLFLRNTYQIYSGVTAHAKSTIARTNTRMLIGPWPHIFCAECVQLPNARVDDAAYSLAWMDRWLKGTPNAAFDYPVILYVMGENRWRAEETWPLRDAVLTSYYLHSGGGANSSDGDGSLSAAPPMGEPSDHFTYDPARPVQSLRGHTLYGGRVDQTSVEKRTDVLVYSTGPLTQEIEVTGEIKVSLYAASSATDTDWDVKLVDVYPDGKAYNLTSGVVRARYRHSRSAPMALVPGAVENYSIDLWATSNVFKKGHRIRVEIASSDFPNIDLNPNAFIDLTRSSQKDYVVARQTVFHDGAHPSRIELPVVGKEHHRRWIATPFQSSAPMRGYVSVQQDWNARPRIVPDNMSAH